MRHLLAALRVRLAPHILTATTFHECCDEVCTPACRHEAIREQARFRAQEIGLYRR